MGSTHPLMALLPLHHRLTPAGRVDVRDLGANLAVVALVADEQGLALGLQLGNPCEKHGLPVIGYQQAIHRALTASEIAILPMAFALTDKRGLMLKATTGFELSEPLPASEVRASVIAGWPARKIAVATAMRPGLQ